MVQTRRPDLPLLLGMMLSLAACVRAGSAGAPAVDDSRPTQDTFLGDGLDPGPADGRLPDKLRSLDLALPEMRLQDSLLSDVVDAAPLDSCPLDAPLLPDASPPDRNGTPEGAFALMLLPAIADASVKDGSPDTNFGDSEELCLGFCSDSSNYNMKSWLKFDLRPIPADATVTSAKLYLFFFVHWGSQNYALRFSADDSWSEQSITWNTQVAADPSPAATCKAFTQEDVWRAFDVTPLVHQEISGDKILSVVLEGETLFDPSALPGDHENYAYAKEAANADLRPHLEVALSF